MMAAEAAKPPPIDENAVVRIVKPLNDEELRLFEAGRTTYALCAGCHQPDGRGLPGLAPSLVELLLARRQGATDELRRGCRIAQQRDEPGHFAAEGRGIREQGSAGLVKVQGRRVETRPIAGTYPRGSDEEEDRLELPSGEYEIPLIVAGGPRSADTETVLAYVSDALRGGVAGVAMGRNVFQADRPGWMAASIARLVHESPHVPDRYDVDNRLALTS